MPSPAKALEAAERKSASSGMSAEILFNVSPMLSSGDENGGVGVPAAIIL
jgi:hypothetical protein